MYPERKKEELKNKASQQLESINNEILALNQKKDLLENTIAELKKGSDEMAFEAEKQSKLEISRSSYSLLYYSILSLCSFVRIRFLRTLYVLRCCDITATLFFPV